ncbi:hypothetical protein [Streptomyces sp. NPDC101237]|uniref:hypothetical protein n=1 Tax=Streptomyces sp. NPDC101237 TaxID=3366139 RepID=UPI00381014F9
MVTTRITPGTADRWNLTVRELHTYYVVAGGVPILVHNTDEACGLGWANAPKDSGHRIDYEIRDKDGNLKVAGGLWSGNTTPQEAAIEGGWNRQAAANTEHRLMRMFGVAPEFEMPDGDPYFGLLMHVPPESGDTLYINNEPFSTSAGLLTRLAPG